MMKQSRSSVVAFRWALALIVFLASGLLPGADQPVPSQPRTGPPALKMEFKLLVMADNLAQTTKVLKLDQHHAVKETVCFFDTSEGTLAANGLILRARQQAGATGESTVKLRLDGDAPLSEAEKAIKPEQDWSNENGPGISRSLSRKGLPDGLVQKVAEGRADAGILFNDAQRKLVMMRMKDFRWERLKRYGPVEAEVWDEQWSFEGYPGAVTVELWHLQQGDRAQDILEASTKAKAQTEVQAKALAGQFFTAAKAAGLGQPAGQTKTQMVLGFYTPGR